MKAIRRPSGDQAGYSTYTPGLITRRPVPSGWITPRSNQVVVSLEPQEIADSGAVITRGKLPTLHGDEHQLERVFLNLIANALKFGGDEPPRVHVDASRESGAWRISSNRIVEPEYHATIEP